MKIKKDPVAGMTARCWWLRKAPRAGQTAIQSHPAVVPLQVTVNRRKFTVSWLNKQITTSLEESDDDDVPQRYTAEEEQPIVDHNASSAPATGNVNTNVQPDVAPMNIEIPDVAQPVACTSTQMASGQPVASVTYQLTSQPTTDVAPMNIEIPDVEQPVASTSTKMASGQPVASTYQLTSQPTTGDPVASITRSTSGHPAASMSSPTTAQPVAALLTSWKQTHKPAILHI
ncbi:NADH dehydrogenase (ubiquinone) complex I, assembly factor 6-like [Dorcoceras hygrometricum]|uniref:NADH dehydrogenase (Ubiquinone) complex I, assembly factor 6-like n=1 Tax=Dorcoceras hygrometricum TaxID=472368 RepID=A0A2Z7BQU9_9LAMI|nr:NADH dehydrogenase (ubiquinone) complex I, assembly factor 6-like [Dorcoceras hygrometricum]